MSKSRWLNDVAQALQRQGLSRNYIRRFRDELADHVDELSQETGGMDANAFTSRLGSPDELAARSAAGLRRSTYAGRHPIVTFVAAPLPTAALMLVGLCAAFVLVLSNLPQPADDRIPVWAEGALQAIVWAMRCVPFFAGGILFCQLAKRATCGVRWSFVACAMVAVLAGLFAVNVTMPTGGPGSGSLMMGFTIPPGPTQWLQALVPLAVWFVYSRRDLGGQSQLA